METKKETLQTPPLFNYNISVNFESVINKPRLYIPNRVSGFKMSKKREAFLSFYNISHEIHQTLSKFPNVSANGFLKSFTIKILVIITH